MRGRLFIFSGIDGAGKSTQIDRIAALLADHGYAPVTVWTRGGYTRGVNLLKTILRRASSNRIVPAPGPSHERTRAFANPVVRKLWLTLAILDLIRVYAFTIRWQKVMGRVVLCDRYLKDSLLDFQRNYPSEDVKDWLLWRMLVWSTPDPHAQFMLLVPVSVSQHRSRTKHEPFPSSNATLEWRLDAYRNWATADSRWTVVDGERPADETTHIIVQEIRRFCPRLSMTRETVNPVPSRAASESAGAAPTTDDPGSTVCS